MPKSLDLYKGKLMKHTRKAVKAGHPADRVFAVCPVTTDIDGKKYLTAWKCVALPDGKLKHPGYKKPLARTDERLFNSKTARNGAEPTALFRPDSYYELA